MHFRQIKILLRALSRGAGGLCAAAAIMAAHAAPVIATVDNGANAGVHTSIGRGFGALAGSVLIAYYDAANGDLKVARCTTLCDRPGASWAAATVDSGGEVGLYPSLHFDSLGNPMVSYYDATRDALKLAACAAACDTTAPSWVITTVDTGTSGTGRFTSLRSGPAGNAVIAYRNRTGDLKLATCTAGCATAAPTWSITTLDGAGPGATSLQFDSSGRMFLAYLDSSTGAVRHATCAAGCTSAAAWTITTVDVVQGDPEAQLTVQVNEGFPVVTYYDRGSGDLKYAACSGSCASPAAAWGRAIVDNVGDAGRSHSMILNGGRASVLYSGIISSCNGTGAARICREASELRLAICSSGTCTAASTWSVTTIDRVPSRGISLVRAGDSVYGSYQDSATGRLKVTYIPLDEQGSANPTALWWDSEESGWGINVNLQGDIVFATLFTYDASGSPLWLVMSSGARQAAGTYAGTLYRTTGPAFNAQPFTPIGPGNIVPVGTMSLGFAGDAAALTYEVNGVVVNKTIRRQVFGSRAAACAATTQSRATLTNYQDLWWNPAEAGWGLNLTHQGDVMFGTLFTYDAGGRATWFVMSAGTKQFDGSYAGTLYRVTGPPFDSVPFRPVQPAGIAAVGTMQLRFSDGENGTLNYSVDGAAVAKSITRQVFSNPRPGCFGG